MNVFVACEESQRVCIAFRESGYITGIDVTNDLKGGDE